MQAKLAEPPKVSDSLDVADVEVHFRGLAALGGVDLSLPRGTILGLIGPNGAGKTTLVNVMSGYQMPTRGRVVFNGADVTTLPPRRLARLGIARTFQSGRLFRDLSTLENVQLGTLGIGGNVRLARERAWELLYEVGLDTKASFRAGALPYGDQRRLGVIRAVATQPSFLLLDEPAAGLNETETDELLGLIAGIRDRYTCGICVIEHDMRLIMGLCDVIHVLDHGLTIALGTPAEVRRSPAVIEAYLGRREVTTDANG